MSLHLFSYCKDMFDYCLYLSLVCISIVEFTNNMKGTSRSVFFQTKITKSGASLVFCYPNINQNTTVDKQTFLD